MKQEPIINEIASQLGMQLSTTEKNGRDLLAARINEMITGAFDQLVSILYRMDVSEKKLKNLLAANPSEDAGRLIADLMIERHLQKTESRREHRRDDNISEEEKW
jgi:hypothetical protein